MDRFLAPALRLDDVLVLDNLNSHKVAGGREAVEAAGASLRYLPPRPEPDRDRLDTARLIVTLL